MTVTAFEIRRQEWMRGERSRLFDPTRARESRCCVGLYLRACGVPDAALADRSNASDIRDVQLPDETEWLFDEFAEAPCYGDSEAAEFLYDENDSTDVAESSIARLFAAQGITVTFRD